MEHPGATTQPSGPLHPQTLAARAAALKELAEKCKDWQKRADDIGRFATRRDELDTLARRIANAASAYQALAADAKVRIHLDPASTIATRLQAKAKDLVHQVTTNPHSILKQRALDAFKEEELVGIERALHASWQWFLGAGERAGIETVLLRFSALRETATRLARLRSSLQKHAEKLPMTPEAIEEGRRLKQALATELESLKGGGLDEDVLAFLRRSLEGVPLPELLKNERVLAWLRDNHLMSYFQVRST